VQIMGDLCIPGQHGSDHATQEQRLEAVSCKALFGPDLSPRFVLARRALCPCPHGATVP
jgi:hypothetical protein